MSEKEMRSKSTNVKLYVGDVAKLFGLSASVRDILYEVLQCVSDNTQEVTLDNGIKGKMAHIVGVSTRTVDNALQELVKLGVLHRVIAGTFIPNVELFGKVKCNNGVDSTTNIRLEITYSSSTNVKCIRGYEEPAGGTEC